MCIALLSACGCGKKIEQIGGVSGKTEVAGAPLPAGTQITFYKTESDINSFSVRVDQNGNYQYKPAVGVPVALGKYKVTLTPPQAPVIEQNGMSIPDPNWKEVKPSFEEKYQKKETTPLEVSLTNEPTVFDIQISDSATK